MTKALLLDDDGKIPLSSGNTNKKETEKEYTISWIGWKTEQYGTRKEKKGNSFEIYLRLSQLLLSPIFFSTISI